MDDPQFEDVDPLLLGMAGSVAQSRKLIDQSRRLLEQTALMTGAKGRLSVRPEPGDPDSDGAN